MRALAVVEAAEDGVAEVNADLRRMSEPFGSAEQSPDCEPTSTYLSLFADMASGSCDAAAM